MFQNATTFFVLCTSVRHAEAIGICFRRQTHVVVVA